jgi:glycosyltransferase involved in cell wall biosynthesis
LPLIFVMARSVYYFTDSRECGGAEAALLLLIEHLDRSEWRPTLLYSAFPKVADLVDAAEALGATVRAVPPLPLGPKGLSRVPRLARELQRDGPAVFHAHLSWPLASMYPLGAAVLARIPAVVATFHLFPPGSFGRPSLLQSRLLGAGVGRAVAVSQAIAALVVEVLGWPAHKVELIRNGVAIERLQQPRDSALREALTAGSDDFVFLTVARLDPQKGLDVLVRAARSLGSARFVIAGTGPERARLEADAAALGLGERVLFVGHRADVPALLAASDAFVLPSLFEGTPLALLEAMAAGKPVIASAIPGTDEIVVDGESGLLVRPGDSADLAATLERIVADPELRARLGAAAQRRAEAEFSAASSTERVMAVYDKLLRERRDRL